MSWLSDAFNGCVLTEPVEDYLLGRGVKETTILNEGMVAWNPPEIDITDQLFVKRYGKKGSLLTDMAICPVWSPKGRVIGFEARSIHRKFITDFRMPEAGWNPFWIGMHGAMPKIWAGGDVWIGEGMFDIAPLEWVIPEKDAVLASVRAKLTYQHVQFLSRFCKGWVHMVYDRDDAGRKGVLGYIDETGKQRWGALAMLRHAGLKCRDVVYQGGKDPGEIWDRGGLPAMKQAFPL